MLSRTKLLSVVSTLFIACFLGGTFFILVSFAPAVASSHILRVDVDLATGDEDGSDWNHAFHNLQDALAAAEAGDEIWVAEGVYYPDVGSGVTDNDESASFVLKTGVAIYGGFAATETARAQRNYTDTLTVLSGDIDNNDTDPDLDDVIAIATDIMGENSDHVVYASGVNDTAVLDGFTVTAGQADGVDFDGIGGGIYNENSSPSLANVTIAGNSASFGGGGVCNSNSSSPSLVNVTIAGNSASFGGGGVCNSNSSSPSLLNVTIAGNSATNGGGVCNYDSSPSLVNVTIAGNSATNGGGIYSYQSDPSLVNVTIAGNSASSNGGGIYSFSSSLRLINAILWHNSASGSTSSTSASIRNLSGGSITVTHSLIANSNGSGGSWDTTMGADGGGNIDSDPLFVASLSPSFAPTTTGDFRLAVISPAIDAGDTVSYTNATSEATDLDGNDRIFNTVIDMGAYEVQQYPLTVVVTGTGGGTVTDAFGNISCGVTCTAGFDTGEVVTLTATADNGNLFVGWSGALSGSAISNTITITQGEIVTATFYNTADPIVIAPTTAVSVNADDYSITGTAQVDALVRVYSDSNNNGTIDGADAQVGSQQLAGGRTNFSISVPLTEDADNNFLVTAEFSSDETDPVDVPTITEDSVLPAVASIARGGTNPTNAASVDFTVTFSETVTGVDVGDFVIDQSGLTGASVASVSGGGDTYTVTVSTGSGSGSVSIDFDADANSGVTDGAGNVSTVDYIAGEAYTIEKDSPFITAFTRHTPISETTQADILIFGITFSEDVVNVDATDFDISGTTATGIISGTGRVYSLTVSGGDLADLNGAVSLNVSGTQNIVDTVGNPLLAAEPATDEVYTLENNFFIFLPFVIAGSD